MEELGKWMKRMLLIAFSMYVSLALGLEVAMRTRMWRLPFFILWFWIIVFPIAYGVYHELRKVGDEQ